jgi:hypothetical protein
MSLVRFKEGVLIGSSHALCEIMLALQRTAQIDGVDLMITAISEGTHLPNSRHYKFEAMDVRSNCFNDEWKHKVKADLEFYLGPKFGVLLEDEGKPNEHFHIQVKYGTTYHEG